MLRIAEFENHANLFYSEEMKAIRVEWKKLYMSKDKWLEIINRAIELGREHDVSIWIADLYESEGMFSNDVIEYWTSNGIDLIKNNGFRYVLTVNPKKIGLTSISDKTWKKPVSEKNAFQLFEFPDMKGVKQWINEFQLVLNEA